MDKKETLINKLNELNIKKEYLNNLDFEHWLLYYYREHLEKNGSQYLINEYNKFLELLDKKYTNILDDKNEQEEYEKLFIEMVDTYDSRTHILNNEIKRLKEDIQNYCEIPNLEYKEWLKKYYRPCILRQPKEIKEQYSLAVTNQLKYIAYYLHHEPFEKFSLGDFEYNRLEDYITEAYDIYLHTQITDFIPFRRRCLI